MFYLSNNLHFSKIKVKDLENGNFLKLWYHDFRKKYNHDQHINKNINSSRTQLNKDHSENLKDLIKSKQEDIKNTKFTFNQYGAKLSNCNLFLQGVKTLTLDKDIKNMTDQELEIVKIYFKDHINLIEKFLNKSKDNIDFEFKINSYSLHLDEKSPHLHFWLDCKNAKSGKYNINKILDKYGLTELKKAEDNLDKAYIKKYPSIFKKAESKDFDKIRKLLNLDQKHFKVEEFKFFKDKINNFIKTIKNEAKINFDEFLQVLDKNTQELINNNKINIDQKLEVLELLKEDLLKKAEDLNNSIKNKSNTFKNTFKK